MQGTTATAVRAAAAQNAVPYAEAAAKIVELVQKGMNVAEWERSAEHPNECK